MKLAVPIKPTHRRAATLVVTALALTAPLAVSPSGAAAATGTTDAAVAARESVPPPLRKTLLRKHTRRTHGNREHTGPRARAAGWYDSGRIHVSAYCFGSLLQVQTPIVKTLSGYRTQWVAIRANHFNASTTSTSDWYYGVAADYGAWLGISGGGRFINVRTGTHHDAPGFVHQLLEAPSNVRVDVAWYSSTALLRHQIVYLNRSDFFNC